jgi:hypothetical protein
VIAHEEQILDDCTLSQNEFGVLVGASSITPPHERRTTAITIRERRKNQKGIFIGKIHIEQTKLHYSINQS